MGTLSPQVTGCRPQPSPARWVLPGTYTTYLLLEPIPWARWSFGGLSSNATFLKPPKQAVYEIWTRTTTNVGLTCPFLKRQRNRLSFYFQGAIAAGTKENRGGNTFLKPFPKHLHLHAGWWTMSTHYVMLGADQGVHISEPVRSQTFSSKGAAFFSVFLWLNYPPAGAEVQRVGKH